MVTYTLNEPVQCLWNNKCIYDAIIIQSSTDKIRVKFEDNTSSDVNPKSIKRMLQTEDLDFTKNEIIMVTDTHCNTCTLYPAEIKTIYKGCNENLFWIVFEKSHLGKYVRKKHMRHVEDFQREHLMNKKRKTNDTDQYNQLDDSTEVSDDNDKLDCLPLGWRVIRYGRTYVYTDGINKTKLITDAYEIEKNKLQSSEIQKKSNSELSSRSRLSKTQSLWNIVKNEVKLKTILSYWKGLAQNGKLTRYKYITVNQLKTAIHKNPSIVESLKQRIDSAPPTNILNEFYTFMKPYILTKESNDKDYITYQADILKYITPHYDSKIQMLERWEFLLSLAIAKEIPEQEHMISIFNDIKDRKIHADVKTKFENIVSGKTEEKDAFCKRMQDLSLRIIPHLAKKLY